MSVAPTQAGAATALDHRRLTRHVLLNGLGWVLPAALALAAVPALARLLGADRFGLLSVAWAAVSAFAILDLGLGRALSLLVADRRARGRDGEIPALVRASGVVSWAVFAPVATITALLSPWLAREAMELPPALLDEGVRTLALLSLSLPIVVHGIVLRAAFEGDLRFGAVNALRIPLGVVTWAGPWVAALVTADVSVLAAVIVGGRTLYWLAQLLMLRRETATAHDRGVTASPYADLWSAGSWITLSGIVSPILTTLDRLVVPVIAPIAAAGWYIAAGEGATKLWLFPAALGPVLAPALAAAFARDDHDGAVRLTLRGLRATGGLLLVPVIVLVLWADPILRLWLADAFAPEVVPLFAGFVVAVYLNSIAQVAYAALQAGGHARAAAQLHLLELPVFLVALLWGASRFGIAGAALAWGGRLAVDALLMMALAVRRVGIPAREPLLWAAVSAGLATLLALG